MILNLFRKITRITTGAKGFYFVINQIQVFAPKNGNYEKHDHGLVDVRGSLLSRIVITFIQYL